MRNNPLLYEINVWVWCAALARKLGRPVTLASIPEAELDGLAAWGFDAVWLMGVWERSPAGRSVALEARGLQDEYRRALPDVRAEDVVGSPYAVRRYEVDPYLGGNDALASIRETLARRGLGLVLDFVPNHTATDHPWIREAPGCFIQGDEGDLAAHPEAFFRAETGPGSIAGEAAPARGAVVAHGRDPYFAPWTDTAQVQAFSPELRARATATLRDIASRCDGVRCDMAMLLTTAVFQRTWGDRAGPAPEVEYWQEIIANVKAQRPSFLFLAEVYWDMEAEMLRQGFDLTYDKRLYDRLRHEQPASVRAHLSADLAHQARQLRFIENHDEPRAAVALGPGRAAAAAVLIATLPGATLIHEGQLTGQRVKLPVQLGRRPDEPADAACEAFYRRLLGDAAHPVYHHGVFSMRSVEPAWAGSGSHEALIAYTWRLGNERRLVVVNVSGGPAQGRIALSDFDLAGQSFRLDDLLDDARYDRDGDEMVGPGLYVRLAGFQSHVLRFSTGSAGRAGLPVPIPGPSPSRA